jgi:hypothetical protein
MRVWNARYSSGRVTTFWASSRDEGWRKAIYAWRYVSEEVLAVWEV